MANSRLLQAIHTNPQVSGCGSNVTMTGNIMTGLTAVEQPQISYLPPSPDNTDPFPLIPVVAHCSTPNATLRYTTDGRRPEVRPRRLFILFWTPFTHFLHVRCGVLDSVSMLTADC